MSFKQEMVSDFKSSMTFLIDSMLETLSYVSRGRIMMGKQACHVQTEKFSSFFEKVSEDDLLLENLQKKVVVPLFNTNSMSFLSPLIDANGKVSDDFLKCQKREEEDDGSFKIRTNPDGIYFQISKVFLPVSEVYTEAVKACVERKGENLPYPNKILLGLYSVIFHSIRETTEQDQLDVINDSRKILAESLESCDETPRSGSESGPMGMIKNLLGNIDFNQIGDMMQKVSGDEKSSKEFGDVFSKISDSIKTGGNPLEAMGDIIKEVSAQAAMGGERGEIDEEEPQALETVEEGETEVPGEPTEAATSQE